MGQTSIVLDPDVATPGMIADSGNDHIITITNEAITQVTTVTIASVVNTTLYEVFINGVPCSYTSDGTALEAEINVGLLAAINDSVFNGDGLSFDVTAVQGATTATIILTAVVEGTGFVYSVTATILTVAATAVNSGVVPFGVGVVQGAADNTGRLPTGSGDTLLGISVIDQMQVNQIVTGTHEYPIDQAMGVMTQGRIWVTVEDAVAIGGNVYARYTTGTNGTQLGAIRSDGDSSKAAQLTGAVFASTQATPGGLAVVSINKP